MYEDGYSQKTISAKFGFKRIRGSVRLIETDVKDLRKRMRKYLYKPKKV